MTTTAKMKSVVFSTPQTHSHRTHHHQHLKILTLHSDRFSFFRFVWWHDDGEGKKIEMLWKRDKSKDESKKIKFKLVLEGKKCTQSCKRNEKHEIFCYRHMMMMTMSNNSFFFLPFLQLMERSTIIERQQVTLPPSRDAHKSGFNDDVDGSEGKQITKRSKEWEKFSSSLELKWDQASGIDKKKTKIELKHRSRTRIMTKCWQ